MQHNANEWRESRLSEEVGEGGLHAAHRISVAASRADEGPMMTEPSASRLLWARRPGGNDRVHLLARAACG